jgi:lipoyl(octanoyl) transferase
MAERGRIEMVGRDGDMIETFGQTLGSMRATYVAAAPPPSGSMVRHAPYRRPIHGSVGSPFRPPCYRATVEAALVDRTVGDPGRGAPLHTRWLGRIDYREAHTLQKRLVESRAAGDIGDQLLLLEHPRVLTLGRHSDPEHIRVTAAELAAHEIDVIRTERGGEVTYHGPGQLVAYPIVRLHERGLLIRPFVRALEQALIATCAAHGVQSDRRDGHPGCWCAVEEVQPRKIGALGLRVERGISYHGIALNVTVDLADFELIDACGLPGTLSTSLARERGDLDARPSTASVEGAAWLFARAFARVIDAPLDIETGDMETSDVPTDAGPEV